jgi:hypothetical protein
LRRTQRRIERLASVVRADFKLFRVEEERPTGVRHIFPGRVRRLPTPVARLPARLENGAAASGRSLIFIRCEGTRIAARERTTTPSP